MTFVTLTPGIRSAAERKKFSSSVDFTNTTTKLVTHNLDTNNPLITCYTTDNRRIQPAHMKIVDNNSFFITFNTALVVRIVVI